MLLAGSVAAGPSAAAPRASKAAKELTWAVATPVSMSPLKALAGNAPYIVNRHTGEIRTTGTAQPIEQYIEEYERELARR